MPRKKAEPEKITPAKIITTALAVLDETPKKSRKKSSKKVDSDKLEKTLEAFYELIADTSDKFSSQIDTATRHYKYLGAAIEHLEKQYKGLYEIVRQNQIGVQNVYDRIHVILNVPEYQKRINKALKLMVDYAYLDEVDYKDWVIDQIAHELLGDEYGMWAERRECKHWRTGRRPPLSLEVRKDRGETESQARLRRLIDDAENS